MWEDVISPLHSRYYYWISTLVLAEKHTEISRDFSDRQKLYWSSGADRSYSCSVSGYYVNTGWFLASWLISSDNSNHVAQNTWNDCLSSPQSLSANVELSNHYWWLKLYAFYVSKKVIFCTLRAQLRIVPKKLALTSACGALAYRGACPGWWNHSCKALKGANWDECPVGN